MVTSHDDDKDEDQDGFILSEIEINYFMIKISVYKFNSVNIW
jgi:hypothetical protein